MGRRHDSATQFCVEFFGGPFDGFIYEAGGVMPSLPFFVAMPIDAAAMDALRTSRIDATANSTSRAYYELGEEDGNWRYRFVAVVRQQPRGARAWPQRILLKLRKWLRRSAA